MNSILSETRQKLVWSALFLVLVAMGSIWIWRMFGEQTQTEARWRAKTTKGSVLAVFGQAPEFSLTERSKAPFSNANLKGKPWIADFIFTSCAGQCPVMSLHMKRLQTLFPKETGMQLVSFTVDPDRDSPEILSEYANRYEAKPDQWFFLTGPKTEINRILKGFLLSGAEEPAMHSTRFILVDRQGKIRGYYDSAEPTSLNQLIHDAKLLLKGS